MTEQAIKKLDTEFKDCKGLSQKGKAVSLPVLDALKSFCEQNTEFAQAVVQTDKTFKDCVESTVKGCGNAISDEDVYTKAADFYFSGAKVYCKPVIDLGDDGFSNKKPMKLSLDDLLDF